MGIVYAFVIAVTGFVMVSGTDCPDRWMPYGGSCYLFGHNNVHFTEAEEYCRHHNANLAEIDTDAENAFLKDYLMEMKFGDYYWIGMTDEDAEGIWKLYHTGTRVQFTDWGATQPHNAGPSPGEDCAIFSIAYGMKWAAVSCTRPFKALCEIKPAGCSGELVG